MSKSRKHQTGRKSQFRSNDFPIEPAFEEEFAAHSEALKKLVYADEFGDIPQSKNKLAGQVSFPEQTHEKNNPTTEQTQKARDEHYASMKALREAYVREKEAKATAVIAGKATSTRKPTDQESLPGHNSFYEPSNGDSDYLSQDDIAEMVADLEYQRMWNEQVYGKLPAQDSSNTDMSKRTGNQQKKADRTSTLKGETVNNDTVMDTVTVFTVDERMRLLLERYEFLNYKGVICPTDGSSLYTRDSIKRKKHRASKSDSNALQPDKVYNSTVKGFYRDYSLKLHVSGGDNLAVFTPDAKAKFIAFDFDDSTRENTVDMLQSVRMTIGIIDSIGLVPFLYYSGDKGFHLEVFFDEPVDINKLKTLNRIIISQYKAKDGKYMDNNIQPSDSAYRIFGSWHYRTKKFSEALIINISMVGDDKGGKSRRINLTSCETPDKSWEHFANATINDSSLLDDILMKNPAKFEPVPKSLKESRRDRRHTANFVPKPLYYNPAILKTIHESGLFGEYRRHYTAYHLGRFFRHELKLTEKQAREEIITWLQRHYEEFHQSLQVKNILPFEDTACGLIKSAYEACCYDTLQNCKNGYAVGKPFGKERVEIFHQLAFDYINGLDYNRGRKKALVNLLDKAMELSSLDIGFEYPKLREIFDVGSNTTIRAWLDEFEQDNILICTKKGTFKTYSKPRLASQYRLLLPEYCYRVIGDK